MTRTSKRFDMELLFRALADRTRLRLLNLLGDDEVCVCFLVEVLGAPQPKISRHLAYLRRAGVVAARRQGSWMHYRIAPPADEDAAHVFADVRRWLGNDARMHADRKRLVKITCAPSLPVHLAAAPRPAPVDTCACT
jgi:ArsR family transcriptional regulator